LEFNCRYFDAVTVLAEGPFPMGWPGEHWLSQDRRQTYADLLNRTDDCGPDDIVVVANADIVIQGVMLELIRDHIQSGEVYALTRYDAMPDGTRQLFDSAHSQDTWVFRGPPKPNIGGDYHFGKPGVDNRFAHELQASGYRVLNPSKSIVTCHIHLSGHRPGNTAANRVPPPYLFVAPHALGEKPRYSRPLKPSRRKSQVAT
jgi:hypothetical protein